MPHFLSDDELLDVPLGNLMPGELARSFKVHATHDRKSEETASVQAMQRLEKQRTEEAWREQEEEQQQLLQREKAALSRIAEREEYLRIEAQHLDDRAIKLHDGRRAYVDGDRYRDAEGHELSGADRAQAEVLHLEHPDAATWQEKQRIDKMWAETQKARKDIEDAQAGKPGTDPAAAVRSAETILAKSNAINALPDYGSSEITLPSPTLKP